MFNEYAGAFDGNPQCDATGNVRDVFPFIIGPPSGAISVAEPTIGVGSWGIFWSSEAMLRLLIARV